MRLAVRWLACLATVTFLLVWAFQHQPSTLASLVSDTSNSILDNLPLPTKPQPDGAHLDADGVASPAQSISAAAPTDIGVFWSKWSQAMYAARPTSAVIKLNGQASTLHPKIDEPRKPFKDFVSNSEDDIHSLRASHARFVQELGNIHGDARVFSGRGIVMVGGGEYFGPAIISIHMLRRTGSTLPVEVFVPNNDEYEKDVCEKYLPQLNAKCRVLSHVLSQGVKLEIKHYQLKSAALLFSSFEEVLLLDSDSMPLLDPSTSIFDVEPYVSSGLIIWPDFWVATESPKFWDIAGLPEYPSGLPKTSSEAGQLVINKRTHLASLLLATYYNMFGEHYYYHLLSQGALGEGDKETFMAAAVALNATYYRVKTKVAALGRFDGWSEKGTAMVQHLPSDDLEDRPVVRPAFLHSNTPKMNAGHLVDEGDLISKDRQRRLRLLGSREDQEKRFGFDIESGIWDLLVQTGCELAHVIREWKHREKLCERLEEHHSALFGDDPLHIISGQ